MSEQHVFQVTLTDEKEIRLLIALLGMGLIWAQLLILHKEATEETLPIEDPFKDAMDLLVEHMPDRQNRALWGAHLTLQQEPYCTTIDADALWDKIHKAYGLHMGYLRNYPEGP